MQGKFYLDSSFFVYLLTEEPELGTYLLPKLKEMQIITSALAYDELVWVVKKRKGKETAHQCADIFLHFPIKIIDVNLELLSASKKIMLENDLDPRDSIHLATALKEKATHFITNDHDFAQVKDIGISKISDFVRKILKD